MKLVYIITILLKILSCRRLDNQYDCFFVLLYKKKKRGPGSDQINGFTERTKIKDCNEMYY